MTGSASISRDQFRRIEFEVKLWDSIAPEHEVVTIVIHPSLTKAGVVRVDLHRREADSRHFGVARDGALLPSAQAA